MDTYHYKYIAIEGNIGAGKTSLATRLAGETGARLILEQFEDNSFLPKFYEDQERYAFPLELSFLADRFHQLKKGVSSHDLFSPFIIADYFIHKSLIFARKTLNDEEYKLYFTMFDIIDTVLPKPELLIYLYCSVDRLHANIRKRGRSYEQKIASEYLQKIQDGYLDYIRKQQEMRIVIIDTNNIDFVENPEDYPKLKKIILDEYPVGVHRITP